MQQRLLILVCVLLLGNSIWFAATRYLRPWLQNRRPHPAFAHVEDRPGVPKILLIGDSISIGYTQAVREALRDRFDVMRIPQSGESSSFILQNLDRWLAANKWSIIHFNTGLHDLRRDKDPSGDCMVSLKDYESNLRAIVNRMRKTGAKVIFATTTPVPEGAKGRHETDRIRYNEVARRVMEEMEVHINPLDQSPLLPMYQRKADVHFLPEGYAVMGLLVAQEIEKVAESKERNRARQFSSP